MSKLIRGDGAEECCRRTFHGNSLTVVHWSSFSEADRCVQEEKTALWCRVVCLRVHYKNRRTDSHVKDVHDVSWPSHEPLGADGKP